MESPPHRHLPRLDPAFYQGHAVVHWTMTIKDRASGCLTEKFLQNFRELMLHTAARERIFCPAFCLMPDHLHQVWMGVSPETDQLNGLKFLRRYLNEALHPLELQKQPFDHVLRPQEREQGAFGKICFYILENPVRAGLVQRAQDYPYSGAVIAGYPDLHPFREDYWETFWKIYYRSLKWPE